MTIDLSLQIPDALIERQAGDRVRAEVLQRKRREAETQRIAGSRDSTSGRANEAEVARIG